jgi:type 1 glutamine amidotransferase
MLHHPSAAVGDAVPQIWTFERSLAPPPTGQPYRAFVWMQGHNYSNFADPQIQAMLLRGISWAGKRPVDELSTVRPPRGGGRGMGRGGRGAQN